MSISKKTKKKTKKYVLKFKNILDKSDELNKKFSHFGVEILIVKIGSHTFHKL